MNLIRWSASLGLAFCACALTAGAFGAAPAPPRVEAFGAIPQASEVVLSPDGNTLAWHDETGPEPRIVFFDIATQKYRRMLRVPPEMKLRSLEWADSETLLVTGSETVRYQGVPVRYEVFRTFAADVGGGNSRMLLMSGGSRALVTGASMVAWHLSKPKTVIMSTLDYSATAAGPTLGTRLGGHRGDSGWVTRLFEVDTRTGKGMQIEEGSSFTNDWVIDKDGKAVARSEWNPDGAVYSVMAKDGAGWRQILRQENRGQLVIYGLTADGAAIVASGVLSDGRVKLVAVALDGSGSKVLLEDPANDVTGVIRDRFTGVPIAATLGGLAQDARWFDGQAERRYKSVLQAFPGRRVHVYGESENRQRVVAAVDGPSSPMVFYLVDFKTNKADVVGEEYPELANATLGEVRNITYKARDGVEIPAYLTIPPGDAGKDLPLVVLPHGGPEARDDTGFDWWAQFLALRGYAVLQPQFRGSTGFGADFQRAGYRQWGALMQDDVTDGVKALIEQGVADASRVCIVGASYGGYAALAGAAFTPELYACAVSVNGVSDLSAMLGYVTQHSGGESDSVAYWRDHIGSPTDPKVIAKSPVHSPERIKAPVLILYAADDTVVPAYQSVGMAQALIKLGRPATLIKLSGEDHWLSRTDSRVQVLKEIEQFLDANLRKAH